MSVNNLSDREFIEEYKKSSFRLSIADIVTDIISLFVLMLCLSGIITSIALFIVFPLFCIYSAIENIPSDKLVLCIPFNFAVFIFLLGGIAIHIIAMPLFWEKIRGIIRCFSISPFLCERKAFLKRCGMNEITAYKHYKFINNKVIYMPWIQQVCKMNPSAQYNQTILIKDWYEMDDSVVKEYVFDNEYSNRDIEFYTTRLLSKDLPIRKTFVDRLFKLAIVQDGIHNDEWKLLMQILEDFKFNKNYINLFIRRYGPLRTEFEDERKDSTSTGERTVAFLNPYYAILGLDNSATEEEIKKAYHALALEHHPDLPKNAGRIQECEEMMAKINEAYEKIRG